MSQAIKNLVNKSIYKPANRTNKYSKESYFSSERKLIVESGNGEKWEEEILKKEKRDGVHE